MPALVTVTVLVVAAEPTSWSAKATSPLLVKAGTAPPNSLPINAKVLDCAPPAGRPGPSTRKKLFPVGLPTPGASVTASPMKPAGGAAPGAGVRNGPEGPAIGVAESQPPTPAPAPPIAIG